MENTSNLKQKWLVSIVISVMILAGVGLGSTITGFFAAPPADVGAAEVTPGEGAPVAPEGETETETETEEETPILLGPSGPSSQPGPPQPVIRFSSKFQTSRPGKPLVPNGWWFGELNNKEQDDYPWETDMVNLCPNGFSGAGLCVNLSEYADQGYWSNYTKVNFKNFDLTKKHKIKFYTKPNMTFNSSSAYNATTDDGFMFALEFYNSAGENFDEWFITWNNTGIGYNIPGTWNVGWTDAGRYIPMIVMVEQM